MAKNTGIPEGFHTVTASLTLKNCKAAIDFYKKAFGATERMCMMSPDGRVAHCELQIGDSIIFLGDEFEQGFAKSPQTVGATTGGLCLYVPNVDEVYDRAIKAGAQSKMPVQDMFWGDRYGNLVDPFGHVWAIATQTEVLTQQEIDRRAQEFFAKMKSSAA